MKEIEAAIKMLAQRVKSSNDSGDALKNTQSALNFAHTLSILKELKNKA